MTHMTKEDQERLQYLREQGTLNRDQIADLLVLVRLEDADVKRVEKVEAEEERKEEAERVEAKRVEDKAVFGKGKGK